jgi:hypothetical protein
MANRTVQFYGRAIDATASIAATFDGQPVFTGDVPTNESVMFTTTVDSAFSGTKSVSIQVVSGNLLIGRNSINYGRILNTVFSEAQQAVIYNSEYSPSLRQDKINIWTELANPAFSAEEIATLATATDAELYNLLAAHNVSSSFVGNENTYVSPLGQPGDSRSNIYIDGVLLVIDRRAGQEGDSSFVVRAGSTVTFDLSITTPASGI